MVSVHSGETLKYRVQTRGENKREGNGRKSGEDKSGGK